jgi:toll-interacting protein
MKIGNNFDLISKPDVNSMKYTFRYPLSGKVGDQKEGMIDLVLSFASAQSIAAGRPQLVQQQPVVFMPNVSGRALPVYVQPQPIQQAIQAPPPAQPLTEEDISNLMEMFPSVDKDVIKSIGEANRGNKEATINSLLQLTN